jgi:hypothetical protein
MKVNLNDLPKYSNLPRRLLLSSEADTKSKNKAEVLREFNEDKWGELLVKLNKSEIKSLEYADSLYTNASAEIIGFENGDFFLTNEKLMLEKYINLYADVLGKYINSASALVELGAGYGSKLIGLSKHNKLSCKRFYAGEYTNAGQTLIKMISNYEKIDISVGYCDLNKMEIADLEIPANAVIFTSYSTHYTPANPEDFVSFIARFSPRAVVHFEPLYETHDEETMFGLMCRRYIELNDYSKNFKSIIESGCARLNYKCKLTPNIIGLNPFLPISILEWTK